MAKEKKGKYYIKDYELENMSSYSNYPPSMLKNYPQSLLKAMYTKPLIGRDGGIPESDVAATAFMLEPGTYYGAHAHLRPPRCAGPGSDGQDGPPPRTWEPPPSRRAGQWTLASQGQVDAALPVGTRPPAYS